MKIGINARYLQNRHTGIENYLLNLILNLKKIDRKNEYILFFGNNKPVPEQILDYGLNYDISKVPTHNQIFKILWSHFYLPYAIKRNKVDLFHEPSFVAPLIKTCPTVITVYDLAYLYVPECFTFRNIIYFKTLLSRSIKQADSIITISESSKRDIMINFKVAAEKIKVIYGGVDDYFQTINDTEKIAFFKQKYGIRKSFILAVSLITPRKNLIRLIKSFKLLRDNKKIDCQLVIVGAKGWLYEDVFKETARSKLEGEVIFCDYVSKDCLLHLYNSALLFAYPSLYEGFGLPILEAMACGCPVVSSNISSMPEVCGDAALLVDSKNIEDLSFAINRLITDTSLRNELIKKGKEQAKKFSWRKTAEETLAVYTSTLSK